MERLKQYLDTHKITQTELARLMEVKQPTVWEWLSGDSTPSTANLIKLSAITSLSIDELLDQPKRRVAS